MWIKCIISHYFSINFALESLNWRCAFSWLWNTITEHLKSWNNCINAYRYAFTSEFSTVAPIIYLKAMQRDDHLWFSIHLYCDIIPHRDVSCLSFVLLIANINWCWMYSFFFRAKIKTIFFETNYILWRLNRASIRDLICHANLAFFVFFSSLLQLPINMRESIQSISVLLDLTCGLSISKRAQFKNNQLFSVL